MGKGDKARPVNKEVYNKHYEDIFGKKEDKPKKQTKKDK
jgi:hypothetical protein